MVTGFVHHVVVGFVAKGKLTEMMRLDNYFLAFSVNINVSLLLSFFTLIFYPCLNILSIYLSAYVNLVSSLSNLCRSC